MSCARDVDNRGCVCAYIQCIREHDDKICQWHETAHACNGVVNSTSLMLLFRKSIFCPAPAGDSITRKSIFDALVAGCIPVLFSRASLSQYSWHVPNDKLKDVSVYIPMTEISENNRNFIDILKAIPAEEVLRMQKNIEAIAPTLQYSVIPARVAGGDLNKPGLFWSPPFRDAADVIIEKIVDRKTVSPIEGYSNEALLDQHHKQKEIMEYHEDFAALRSKNLNADKQSKKLTRKVGAALHIFTSPLTTLLSVYSLSHFGAAGYRRGDGAAASNSHQSPAAV